MTHRSGPPLRRLSSLALAAWALALLLAACGGAPPATSALPVNARTFALGVSAVPVDLTQAAYEDVFTRAAALGDIILIQRAIPWQEVAPAAEPSAATRTTLERERALLAKNGLGLAFAIDPWEPTNPGRLVGDPPGAGFRDPAVQAAYLRYAHWVAEEYQPRWLALAVDVDRFQRAAPADFEAFNQTYIRAYRELKQQHPDMQIFVTFQLEALQGLLPWATAETPQWGLLPPFLAYLDMIAVSSYPSFIFPFVSDIPAEYFSRLTAFGKPLALFPVGYASDPGRDGVTFGSGPNQRRFLERILGEAEDQQWDLVIWLSPRDPRYAAAPPFDLVSAMGLETADGAAKPALAVWTAEAARPWAPLPRPSAPALPGAPVPGGSLEPLPPAGAPAATLPTDAAADGASGPAAAPPESN